MRPYSMDLNSVWLNISMPKAKQSAVAVPLLTYEADVPTGLESMAAAEIESLPQIYDVQKEKGAIRFQRPQVRLDMIQHLKLVTAVYLSQVYPVPRPKALLGHQHFQGLIKQIQTAMEHERGAFHTFHLAAAGDDSSVMQRIKSEIAASTGLTADEEGGDLWIRIRRDARKIGWEVLVRTSRRPLVTRAWRVRDWPGAVNAVLAQAAIRLTKPTPEDVFLNIGSGSGTILIERGLSGPAKMLIGCENNADVIAIAQENAQAAPQVPAHWLHADGQKLPIASQSIDALAADLPFGVLVGSTERNEALYPALLNEAARVAKTGARFAIITQAVRIMDSLLPTQRDWQVENMLKVTQGGLHPRLYTLVRR